MNEDLTRRSELVPGYAGHADPQARFLSDQQVRAWVGEMLADLDERLSPGGLRDDLAGALGDLARAFDERSAQIEARLEKHA